MLSAVRTGRDADPAAAPRYLLYRGLSAAHFRPQTGQPEGDGLREAGVRTGVGTTRPAWRKPM